MKKIIGILLLLFTLPAFAQDVHVDCAVLNPCQLTPPGGVPWSIGSGAATPTWIFNPVAANESVYIYIHNNNPTSAHTGIGISVWQSPFSKNIVPTFSKNGDQWIQDQLSNNNATGAPINASCIAVAANINGSNPSASTATGTGVCSLNSIMAGQIAIQMSSMSTQAGSPDTFDIIVMQYPGNINGLMPGSSNVNSGGPVQLLGPSSTFNPWGSPNSGLPTKNIGAVAIQPTSVGTNGISPQKSSALESNRNILGVAGNFWGACITTTGTAGHFMIFDLIAAPVDGAVTPTEDYQVAANSTLCINYGSGPPAAYQNGVTLVFSSTGPFTKTASATAMFFAGRTSN